MKKAGKTSGDIVMINGSPTDPNAADFKKGAHSVLDGSGYKVAAEYDTPDWSPDKAQAWMEGQISARSRATSSASTRPTTAPAVAPSRRSRAAASPRCRRSPVRTPSSPRSSGSSPATRP